MFSTIRPIEELMAIDQTPLETDLRASLNRRRNLYALIWLFGWGSAAAVALVALAFTSQTKNASERLRSIFAASEPAAVAQMPPRVAQLESETEALISQVRTLTVDRDRLAGRIALLESTIDDMTGAIKRQADATAAALAKATAVTPPPPKASPAPTRVAAADLVGAQAPAAAAAPPPAPSSAPAIVAIGSPTAAAAQKPLNDQASMAIPVAAPAPEAAPTTIEFALDLGGATTLDGIRQRWVSVKANFGPLLSGMHPLAAREHRQGASGYRLVVGPLPNNPAATGLCAHFTAARSPCRAARFEGEEFAIAQH